MPKIEMGKKYQTRDGRAVRILTVDRKHRDPNFGPVYALIANPRGEEGRTYTANGCAVGQSATLADDLIEVPEMIEGWLNIYNERHPDIFGTSSAVGYPGSDIYRSRIEADERAMTGIQGKRIACIPIKFHKGQGLK